MGFREKEDTSSELSRRVLALQRLRVRMPGRGSNQAKDTTTAVDMLQINIYYDDHYYGWSLGLYMLFKEH